MRFLLVISLLFASVAASAQCANNNNYVSWLTLDYEGDSDYYSCAKGNRYWRLEVVSGATYQFSTCGGNWDTYITLYSEENGSLLAYNDDYCGYQSFIEWTATFSGTVRILIDEYDCTGYNNCGADLLVSWVAASVGFDVCGGAVSLGCGDTVNGTTSGATTESLSSCGTSITAPGVWYSFEGNGSEVTFSLCGSSLNSKISVFSGSCSSLTCLDGNSSECGDDGEVTLLTSSGVTYFILVHANSSNTGNFTLNITCTSFEADGNRDCAGSLTICTDETFGGNSDDYGNTQDLNDINRGCLSWEHQSSWYVFSPVTTGTIGFMLEPSNGIDYDFAIWGPYESTDVPCPPDAAPLRCSYSGVYGSTGMVEGAGDNSEDPDGDAWVEAIEVTNGEVNKYYVMLIDNYTADNTDYNFHWDLNGVSLNCAIMLPIELVSFTGKVYNDHNELYWLTASELNNSHFTIERSLDASSFEAIGEVLGAGTSVTPNSYIFNDATRPFGTVYYRLKQTDFNGDYSYSDMIALTHDSQMDLIAVFPNPGKGVFTCQLKTKEALLMDVSVFDLQGRLLQKHTWELEEGMNSNIIDISDLHNGNYLLQFSHEGITLNRQQLVKR